MSNKCLEALIYLKTNKRKHWLDTDIAGKYLKVIEKELKEREQYKQIEEEFGIDLITLFKALTSTVYLYHNGELTECEQAPCLLCFDNEYCLEYHFEHDIEQVYLKDCGKTWALTKEELEK